MMDRSVFVFVLLCGRLVSGFCQKFIWTIIVSRIYVITFFERDDHVQRGGTGRGGGGRAGGR